MTENILIGNLLGLEDNKEFFEEGRYSNLCLALTEARKMTGRDLNTGMPLSKVKRDENRNGELKRFQLHSSKLAGTALYLISLDLIGCLFAHKEKQNIPDSILHALKHFTKLNPEEAEDIKKLRNCLAHNFGLGNSGIIYSLSQEYPVLIRKPKPGDEFYKTGTKEERSYTLVNEIMLQNLIEDIYYSLKSLHSKNELRLKRASYSRIQILAHFTIL